ncbi:MAG: hypothetical protein DLM54_00925 [Acidimicrobiales bacterium]|nr:MAG: hypothetical protein DLM54_00925 [Acidimicrobiales bacterium]
MDLTSLTNHSLVVLWVELASLLIVARLLGSLAARIGQPSVVGELVAGLLLGPSVLGQLWPTGFHWFLPAGRLQGSLLLTVTALALVLVLVVIGADTDLGLIASLGRAAGLVSVLSLAVPFAVGFAGGELLPASLLGSHPNRGVFALLVAGCVCVSSLPVVAKVISGLGAVRRNFGQLALAAGTANDIFGFLVVALATGLVGAAAASSSQLPLALGGLAVLVILAFTVGQRVVDALLRQARRQGPNVVASLAVCLIAALVMAAATQAVGVEGALGGFLAGVVLARSRFGQGDALQLLTRLSNAFLAPLYFATAGLRVHLSQLSPGPVLISFVALTLAAALSKFLGAALGGRAARLGWRESAALGIGLNGRGALQVIIATAGLSIGVFSPAAYTVMILLSIVTSVATPPLLRLVVKDWAGSHEERQRLDKEDQLDRNVIVRNQRMLLPSRGSPNSLTAAEVMDCAWPEESGVTILSIGEDEHGNAPDTTVASHVFEPRRVERRHISSEHVLDSILAEAKLGYGVIGLGAAEHPGPDHLLSSVVDDLLAASPIPLLVVRRARQPDQILPPAFSRALVAVTGTAAARAGQEVAYNISRHLGTAISVAHVVTRPPGAGPLEARDVAPTGDDSPPGGESVPTGEGHPVRGEPGPAVPGGEPLAARSAIGTGEGVLREAESLARELGVEPQVLVRHGQSAGPEIVTAAQEAQADLVVMGATVRLVEGRPFLGHTVEHVLAHTDATVVVVVLPDPTTPAMTAERAAAAAS